MPITNLTNQNGNIGKLPVRIQNTIIVVKLIDLPRMLKYTFIKNIANYLLIVYLNRIYD